MMITQLLEVNYSAPFENAGDALAFGLPFSLFGFCTVFAILALLWGILSLFKVVFYTIPEKRKKAAAGGKVTAPAAPVTTTETVSAVSAPAAPASDDGAIVAAITAAIAAYRSASGEAVNGFRVVSFKKRK